MIATFTFPNRILFGEGSRTQLGAELDKLKIRHPLIVTDPGIVASGIVAEIVASLGRGEIFDRVQANPNESDVLLGLNHYQETGCDGLIGLGGGSAIDAAKAIRLLAGHGGKLADYDFLKGGSERITPEMPPMVAIPTTAGTGSEAGRGTLIQVPETGRKLIALSPYLLPSLAVCDPELTRGMSPGLTAGTGMDAFTHGVESYLSTTYHPICDGIALEGLKHVSRGLEVAVRDGSDLKARRAMSLGALMCGIAFHKGLGVVHSLSHALGAEGRAHHGTLNAILLPHSLRFNRDAAGTRMAEVASQLGLGRSGDGPAHLITLSELLVARLNLPAQLRSIEGLDRQEIPHYARLALEDHCHRTNPRPCTQADMERILEQAW